MIYVSSSCLKNNSMPEVICQLADRGIQNIELSGGTDYYDGMEYDLKRLKEKYRLHYACHAYFPPSKIPFVVNLASCNDAIYKKSIEHYDNCIDLLKKIDCNVLSVHAGFLIEINKDEIGRKLSKAVIYDKNEAYSRFCYAYENLTKKCRKQDISLYLENNVLSRENFQEFENQNYLMMTDYESIMYMKEQIDFDLLLDLGHLYVSSGTLGLDYEKECSKLKEYVKWIHISENNGIYDEHKPLVENSRILLEFSKLYHADVNVTLETVGNMEDITKSAALIKSMCF